MNDMHSFGTSKFIALQDGRKLHYMEKGSGNPTVVFESGLGFSRSTWGLVQPVVSERVRAVVYDRAGTGRSEPDPAPRTLRAMAGDLNALLTALGPGPFVLVGHSWGGAIVRAAAAASPERIRGIVLVDQSDENCELYFSYASKMQFSSSRYLIPMLAHTRLYRAVGGKPGSVQPADVTADHHKEDFTVQAARTAAAETAQFLTELKLLKEQPPELGSIEVCVISGTKTTWLERKIRPSVVAAHQQTVARLKNARWVEAPQSGHLIPYSEPDVIIKEIFTMLE